MTVIVTGSSGFLGTAVVRALRAAGHRTYGVDRRPGPGTDLLADLVDLPADAPLPWAAADAVIHLAARAGVRDRTPGIALARQRDNVEATARVLDRTPAGVPLVVASSSSVYGGAHGRPCHEDDPPAPRGGYARSKLAVEALCAARSGPLTVVRPFTVLGEGQRPDMAVSRWAGQARAGRALTLFGSPSRTRDVTDVRDVAAVLVRLAERGGRGVVNVGSGRPHTLAELAAAVGTVVRRPIVLDVRPAGAEEPPDTHADTRRLTAWVGGCPVPDLVDVVGRAVATPSAAMVARELVPATAPA